MNDEQFAAARQESIKRLRRLGFAMVLIGIALIVTAFIIR